MTKHIQIDGRLIGVDQPPYVIAEMSANHNGDLNAAFRLIEEAKRAGADAIKLQTYRPHTVTINSDLPDFQLTKGPWAGRTLYDLYAWAHTPWEWHKQLFDVAKEEGLVCFESKLKNTSCNTSAAVSSSYLLCMKSRLITTK